MAVVRALSLLKDGGLVAVGNVGSFYLKKLNSNGTLDVNFGVNGIVVDGSGTDAMAVAVQNDGKILAVGYGGPMQAAVARYNTNGSKDETFGNNGTVLLSFDGYNVSKDLQVLSDGKILITSFTSLSGQSGTPSVNERVGVARLNQDGTLDQTFGVSGKVVLGSSVPYDWSFVRTQTDGKIILSSTTSSGNGWDLFNVRLNKNGSIDTTYGDSGYASVLYQDTQHARSLNIDKSNNSYIAGSTQLANSDPTRIAYPFNENTPRDFFITKINSRGQLDSAFGDNGKVTVDLGGQDTCQASTIQSDGKIILAGMTWIDDVNHLALTRLNKNGTVDTSFGNSGKVLVQGLDVDARWFEVTDVEITTNGKIVAAFTTGNSSFALTFNSDGSISKGYLLGTESIDHFIGTSSGDILFGLAGDDELYGGSGNDTLYGGDGNDTLNGGHGIDTVDYKDSGSDLVINLESGSGSGVDIGNDALSEIEKVIAGSGDDQIIGLASLSSNLDGGQGDDVLAGGSANDLLNGGVGFDTVDYESSQSDLTINLQLGFATGTDVGRDSLSKIENATGGNGNDVITALSNSKALLEGGGGNDTLNGGNAADTLYGGDGNDVVNAGNGNDLIVGGDGAGNDRYNGGYGIDTVKYSSAQAGITVNLTSGTATSSAGDDAAHIGNDVLSLIENVIAGDFNDTLIGSSLANRLEGGLGNDSLNGLLGSDVLCGGGGADQFIFNTQLSLSSSKSWLPSRPQGSSNLDKVMDFEHGVDQIVLDDFIFKSLKNITDLTNNFVVGTAALQSDDYLIYNNSNGYLYYDANGSAGGGQVAFADIGMGMTLTASDFYII
jgi:uncharacterized delta-60 repeat protein